MIDHDELVQAADDADPAFLERDRSDHRAAPGRRRNRRPRLRQALPPVGRRNLQAAADHAASRRLWPGRRPRPHARKTTRKQAERSDITNPESKEVVA